MEGYVEPNEIERLLLQPLRVNNLKQIINGTGKDKFTYSGHAIAIFQEESLQLKERLEATTWIAKTADDSDETPLWNGKCVLQVRSLIYTNHTSEQ